MPDEDPLAPVSALPSVAARVAAFAAIVLAGACGALIGYAVVKVQCHGHCDTPLGIGAVIGALTGAGGVAVIATLVLRAMGEWRRIRESRSVEGD